MRSCNGPYALCTSAKCIPHPENPQKTLCFCDVLDGKSMGTKSCKDLQPTKDKNGIWTAYSTFSYEQYKQGKKVMTCPGGTPWSWCLNKKCTVDPTDSSKAVCECDVVRSDKEWVTFGGKCNTSTCESAYWSGAGVEDNESANAFMAKEHGLKKSPVSSCN